MCAIESLSAESRIERLERSQRKLRAISGILTLLFLTLVGWQFLPLPARLEARAFVVRDEQRRVRAEFGAWPDGTVMMRLNGMNEKARGLWRLDPGGALSLRFADDVGYGRAELRIEKDGEPSLTFGAANGRTLTRLQVASPNAPALIANPSGGPPTP